MAAVGAEVISSWLLSPGVAGFFILLLLAVFLTALCSDCNRRTFELSDAEADKNPPQLIKVVKLEDTMVARENPMISEIQNDEKKISSDQPGQVTGRRNHLGAPQDHEGLPESSRGNESPVQITPWRSHLGATEHQDVTSSTPPGSNHIYHTIGGGWSGSRSADMSSSSATNHEPGNERDGKEHISAVTVDRNSIYAQVSKKVRQTTPSVHTPEQVEVEEEQPSPPLPDRRTEVEA
uniref:uncharacterized protein LOC109961630 n=1 Tax=Monopterus albus TaxID=43700 RepID=UPI0009B49D4A|nr:uncharacterized protein LOC109961630 [Monopterus albus]XP_020458265.1 uncharacterized protein LOC109961630 [Monopterus albus]